MARNSPRHSGVSFQLSLTKQPIHLGHALIARGAVSSSEAHPPWTGAVMLGSQSLEVAIALVLIFFVLATAASAALEGINRLTCKRSQDLEIAVMNLVTTGNTSASQKATKAAAPSTTADHAQDLERRLKDLLNLGSTKAHANYVSAKAFADAVIQLADEVKDGPSAAALKPLFDKLDTVARTAKGDLTTIKAQLETWFDDAMTDVHSKFKRYSTIFLFVAGLAITIAVNASTVDISR